MLFLFALAYSAIPEDLHRIETLHHFDVRLNRLRYSLPDVMEELPDLARLNVSGNGPHTLGQQKAILIRSPAA